MTETILLRSRADLAQLPGFRDLGVDTAGQPNVWSNTYSCAFDGNSWSDAWSCQCDDECAECGKDLSAVSSDWIGPTDRISRALWETLPEVGEGKAGIAVEIDDGKIALAEGWIAIGSAAPSVVKAGPWPAYDAIARTKIGDLADGAIVFAANAGLPDQKWVGMTVGVVEKGRVVKGTSHSFRVTKAELRDFTEKWETENLAIEPPEDDAAGMSGP